jgi:uncharacterized damage-inducible protein DinB
MKQYLIDTFKFTDWANRCMIEVIKKMREPEKAVVLISHLINSQNRWMHGIEGIAKEKEYNWFNPVFNKDELESKWNESICKWLTLLENLNEEDLEREIIITAKDNFRIGAKIKDIVIQLNNHSIHHRAQIATLLRQQNIQPPFLEYIARVWNKY